RFILCVAICVAISSSVSSAGCLNRESQPTTVTSDQLEIINRYYFDYNGTSFLTGTIVNKATESLVNTNLQAEGYVNDTIYERGQAGPDSGIKSVILPNESAPFMIKMVPVNSRIPAPIPPSNAQNSTNTTSVGKTSRVANQTSNQTVSASAQKPQLSYRIEPQVKSVSSTQPYPLSVINAKAAAYNQAITVNGEVYNGGSKNVSSSIVAAAFYKENGTVLGVFIGSPQGDLVPKKTAPFQIDVQTSAFPIKPARTEIYAYELID
ncbi:MAG: FxLYD domain-containing protein, partial [Halobacteriota archaeon]